MDLFTVTHEELYETEALVNEIGFQSSMPLLFRFSTNSDKRHTMSVNYYHYPYRPLPKTHPSRIPDIFQPNPKINPNMATLMHTMMTNIESMRL